MTVFCFQAEDGIRDLVRSRGLGDVYKGQVPTLTVGGNSCVGTHLLTDNLWHSITGVVSAGTALSLIHI